MIDTKVEGSVADVKGAAIWLRESLKADLTDAGDLGAEGRRIAGRDWEGDDHDAYSSYTRNVVRLTDDHAARVGRAAQAFDDYAARLQRMKTTMSGLRTRASEGGLTVNGDTIAAPPDVAPTVVEPGTPEAAAHQRAIDKVDLYNTLSGDAGTARTDFAQWIQANLVPEVAKAQEDGGVEKVMGEIRSVLPDFLTGLGIGLTGIALKDIAEGYKNKIREHRRRARRSGDPRVKVNPAKVEDWTAKAKWLGKGGRLFSGPVGIGVDVLSGVKEAHDTGDWKRPALSTGAGIVAGGLVVVAIGSAPALLVLGAAGTVSILAGKGAEAIYDNWDNISGWTADRWDDTEKLASDAWDGARDAASETWDSTQDAISDSWAAITSW